MRYQFDRTGWVEVEPARVATTDRFVIIDDTGAQIGPGYPTLDEAETMLGLFDADLRYSVVPLLS